jgi:hypothetical protein
VKKKQFFVNFITIVLFGAVGTLISCTIISLGKYGDFAVVLIMYKFAFELYKGMKNHHTKYVKLHIFLFSLFFFFFPVDSVVKLKNIMIKSLYTWTITYNSPHLFVIIIIIF